MKRWRLCLAVLSIAVTTAATGCGGKKDTALTTADVGKAFAQEGLNLEVERDKFHGVHFLVYAVDPSQSGTRVSIFVFEDPRGVSPYVRSIAGAAGIARTLVVRNVVVFLLAGSTRGERRRALAAVDVLKRR
jgi:uncharacterized membrane protein YtjA (UPF0391 family)